MLGCNCKAPGREGAAAVCASSGADEDVPSSAVVVPCWLALAADEGGTSWSISVPILKKKNCCALSSNGIVLVVVVEAGPKTLFSYCRYAIRQVDLRPGPTHTGEPCFGLCD